MTLVFSAVETALAAVKRGGFEIPAPVSATLAAFEAVTDSAGGADLALAAASAAIRAGDAAAATAAADHYAVLRTVERSQMFSDLFPSVAAHVIDLWPTQDAWEHAAGRYNAAAAAFTAAVGIVDVDAAPGGIMSKPKAEREAWASMPDMVAELDDAARLFSAVAHLADLGFNPGNSEHLIGLLTDASIDDLPQYRAVWDDKRTTFGRAGKWGALVELGATLTAATLEGYEPLLTPVQAPNASVVVHNGAPGVAPLAGI